MKDLILHVLDYWQAGGPLLAPIALVSFAMWAQFLRAHRRLKQAASMPTGLTSTLARIGTEPDLAALAHEVPAVPGMLEAGISEAIQAVRTGRPADDAFQDWQMAQEEMLSRDFVMLAALTAAAPLLGLLGTVMGMIGTFDAVAEASGGTVGKVALGISQALITTQFGLVVAIPGVFGLARLERLLDQARVTMGECRTHILMALQQRGKAFA